MRIRTLLGPVLCLSVLICVPALGQRSPGAVELLQAFPGLQVRDSIDRTMFYGTPMLLAETPEAVAAEWVELYGKALGAHIDLVPDGSFDVHYGQFTVFWYKPSWNNVPSEEGLARVLVRNDPDGSRVVFAAAHKVLVPNPLDEDGGYPAVRMKPQSVLTFARSLPEYAGFNWKRPELVILHDHDYDESLPSIRAWRIGGSNGLPADPKAVSLFVDASQPKLVHVRNEIYHVDIDGEVSGFASPGQLPDTFTNPAVPTLLDQLEVTAASGESDVTNAHGSFIVPFSGIGPVDLTARLEGPWVNVENFAGSNLSETLSATPPGPVDFLLNTGPSEFTTSQVNAFIHTNQIHDLFKEYAPDFTPIDIQLPCNVNIDDNCNAGFSGIDITINFFTSGGGCVNTAFSTVVAHEYGHFIVNRLGLSQGAFGEGFSDVMAIILYDTGLMGQDFEGPGTVVRNIPAANQQYPCTSSAIHQCGQIIGGVWYDTKIRFQAQLGSTLGLEATRQLAVDWAQITLGGQGLNSAHPDTAIEVLTMDDDDGNLGNGTPNYALICEAFAEHGIDCPPLPEVALTFPDGRPELVGDLQETTVRVFVEPVIGTPVAGSGTQYLSLNGGPFQTTPMVDLGGNEYLLTFPALDCGDSLQYYVSADSTGGTEVTEPGDAPSESFRVIVADVLETTVALDFESASDWTAGVAGDTATTGVWEQVDPNGTQAQPGDDVTSGGSDCWVTGQGPPGGGQGENDVDGGATTLLTAVYDLSGGDARISYWRWYSNDTGSSPGNDVFQIDVSNQGGAAGSWVNVETLGPDTQESTGGWFFHEFWLGDIVSPSAQVQLRFIASDEGGGSIVEAAIDEFSIDQSSCVPNQFVRGDCSQDGQLSVTDAVLLLSEVLGGPAGAAITCADACDANDDGNLDVSDAVTFLNFLFVGGSALPAPTTCGEDVATPDSLDCENGSACD